MGEVAPCPAQSRQQHMVLPALLLSALADHLAVGQCITLGPLNEGSYLESGSGRVGDGRRRAHVRRGRSVWRRAGGDDDEASRRE